MGVRGAVRGAATHTHMLMHSRDPNEAEAARVQTLLYTNTLIHSLVILVISLLFFVEAVQSVS